MEAPAWLNAELLWRSAAVTAWVAATAMLVWALAAGRSRGRLRCPGGWVLWPRIRIAHRALGIPWRQGCWYDVGSALPDADGAVLCPECGRRHQPRSLQRTRRRWRWAAAACPVALTGAALWVTPAVQERGWLESAPTFVLVEIPSVDEWLADVGLSQPQTSAGRFVAELHDRLDGRAAKRWTRRLERRLQRAGSLGVDAASVEAMTRLQANAVTGSFDAAPAAEVFAAIEAAAGVALRVDWAGMELAPETPVTIAFDRRRCDLALRDAAWALPRESGAWWALVDGVARIEHWRMRRERCAVVDVEALARWVQDFEAEGHGRARCCVEDDRDDEILYWTLEECVCSIEDIITELACVEAWERNGGAGARLEAVGTTLVIAGSAEVVSEAIRLIGTLDAARASGQSQMAAVLPAGRVHWNGSEEPEPWTLGRGEPLVCIPIGQQLELCDRAAEYCAATAPARTERKAELAHREGNFCGSERSPSLAWEVRELEDAIAESIHPTHWQRNGGEWSMRSLGTILVIDAPAHAHERIAALLDAMRHAQATHQAVEVTGVATEPQHRLRVIPLCGLLLETAAHARLPGAPSALEDDLRQYMLPRLKPHDEHWSLHFVARMAVIQGTDRAHAAFENAVQSLRAGTNPDPATNEP